jgi:hypothetical protein
MVFIVWEFVARGKWMKTGQLIEQEAQMVS